MPECYVDTKLVEMLVPPKKKKYNHQKGYFLSKTMKGEFGDDFARAIIDKDKDAFPYSNECNVICDGTNGLQLLKHPVANHYFVIHPPIERWIVELSILARLSVLDFGLPNDFEKLVSFTKTSKDDHDDPNADKFRRLFIEIRRAKLTPILILTYWIIYLKENPYTPNLDELQAETDRLLADPTD
jgi:hypothetical protein